METKIYTMGEMEKLLKTEGYQPIKRKLERYGVSYITDGWGENRTFNIQNIHDTLKLFCITKLNFAATSDFSRLKFFLYYFFNDVDFQIQPYAEMSRRLSDKDCPVSRQTISKWVNHLMDMELIIKDTSNCRYFRVKGLSRIEVTADEYKKAWGFYWYFKDKFGDSEMAFSYMYDKAGGCLQKRPAIVQNAFYNDITDRLTELLIIYAESCIPNSKTIQSIQ